MRVAVTGASGLLGANLAVELARRGATVVCTRRGTSRIDHLPGDLGLEWVEADLGDLPALTRAFAGCEAVFHCAARVSLRRKPTPELWRDNVGGTQNVLNAVRAAGVRRLVYASSIEALGISESREPVDETVEWNLDRLGLANGYARTKRQALLSVLDAARRDVDAVAVSPTVMLGPYDARPSSGTLIVEVLRGKALGWPAGRNNFVDVRDVARGMIAALERGRRGEDYILGNVNLSFREILTIVARLGGVRPPRFPAPRLATSLVGALGEAAQGVTGREWPVNVSVARYLNSDGYQFRIDKARRELGYEPEPIATAIMDAIVWFRERGMVA